MKRIYLMFALAVLFLAGCGGEKKSGVKETDKAVKQEITVGIASELSTADVSQAMNNTAVEVMSQIGEGLYTFDTQGEVQPAIAKDFAKVSEDGLTYSIELRQDAKWSNGEAVTANDFEYSWKRTVAPETAAEQSYYFDGILNYKEIAAGDKELAELGVKALSDYELEVTLERPMSYFPSMLAIPGFFPLNQEYVESQGDNYGLTSETTLFNGPFTMEGWDGANSEWTYKKNENYWDKENVFLDKINVNVMKETATAVNLFNAEQIDFVQIKGEYVAQESGNKALYIRDLPGTYYLSYNTKNDLLKKQKS